jgi:pimeloyl-ACP methyl ester carboxylesterase
MSAQRYQTDVDGATVSYLSAGISGPVVLLLHGTFWSRVWLPVLGFLSTAGLRPLAVDLPGCGQSGGELTLGAATVPELTSWVLRFVDRLNINEPLLVAGHDIGGAIAQRLLVTGRMTVRKLALVNSVTYDSWPVPAVARFRDPANLISTAPEEIVALRRIAVAGAITRPTSESELDEYVSPWREARVARSWMALAGAADPQYTLELLPALRASDVPKLLVWGEDDVSQKLHFAERFAVEIPKTTLIRIPRAGHIPMETHPEMVGRALTEFFLKS